MSVEHSFYLRLGVFFFFFFMMLVIVRIKQSVEVKFLFSEVEREVLP